jgi:hypothetical protein
MFAATPQYAREVIHAFNDKEFAPLDPQCSGVDPVDSADSAPTPARGSLRPGQVPDGGRVICLDEFGPLNLHPRPGRGWFPRGDPARLRATYSARVRYMIAALNLVNGQRFLPVSATANAGRSSSRSCASCGSFSRPGGV